MPVTACLLLVVMQNFAVSQCTLRVNRKIELTLIDIREQYRIVYDEITS